MKYYLSYRFLTTQFFNMKKLISYLIFIFTKRIIYGLIVFIAIGIFVGFTNTKPVNTAKPTFWEDLTWWSKWLDPILGTAVFLLTVIIGWTQLRDDWEAGLEKRLTVIFKYQGRDVLLCKKAYLTAEGDIRNLGQQIGGQMAKVRFLDFKANDIESKRLGVEKNEFQKGQFFMHYQVVFELTALPNNGKFENANLIWYAPDNSSLETKEEWIALVAEAEEN